MNSLMNKSENMPPSYSSFLPLCLISISMIIIFGWQMTVSVQQYIATIRIADQQVVMADQAAQAESKLQAMMTDLLQLSTTDSEAKSIVTKYRVKLNADKPGAVPLPAAIPREKRTPPVDGVVESAPSPASPSSTN